MKALRKGREGGSLETRHREESLTTFPRDPSGVIHKRDSNNNGKREGLNVSCDHMLFRRPQYLPTSQPGRLYAEVHRVQAHMVWVWLCVGLGGKKGPGNRNPPILTSCFCWKGDLSARRAHQHRAQCSPDSRGDSMFMHGTPHHTKSACQHPEGWCFPNDQGGSKDNSIQSGCLSSCAMAADWVTFLQEAFFRRWDS